MGVIQILSRQSKWTYVYSRELGNPGVVAAWAVVALWYTFMAWWIWSGGLDRSLATFGRRLSERLRDPFSVKVALSVLLLLFLGQCVLTVLRGGPVLAAA